MNLFAHNPEFSDCCSITELLRRIATQSKQIMDLIGKLGSAKTKIVALISQNTDLARQLAEENEQSAKEKTALSQRIEELERSAALDSTNSCKPPSSDGLGKSTGKKDKDKKE